MPLDPNRVPVTGAPGYTTGGDWSDDLRQFVLDLNDTKADLNDLPATIAGNSDLALVDVRNMAPGSIYSIPHTAVPATRPGGRTDIRVCIWGAPAGTPNPAWFQAGDYQDQVG
jgi:hypothetical protein